MLDYFVRALPALIFLAFGLQLSAIDIRTHRLPNRLVGALILMLAICEIWIDTSRFRTAAVVALLCLATYSTLYLISRGQLGLGDVKFSIATGLALGWYVPNQWLTSILLAFTLAGVAATIGIAIKKFDKSSRLAFGPFMFLSVLALITTSAGEVLFG